MSPQFTRRDFLKLSALGLGAVAFRPYFGSGEQLDSADLARVAITSVSVYSQANDKSRILYQRYRDELINIYSEVNSPYGPDYNPIWYRVWRGYVHSAHLERVKMSLNPVLTGFPNKLQLAEVSVPLTQAMRYTRFDGWKRIYRLYYKSNHWLVGVDEGPDGQPWYRIRDELIDLDYHAPAPHFRPIPSEELTPISPNVPPELKRIEVSISRQTLTAYEGDKVVLNTRISSGLPDNRSNPPGGISTNTPLGTYNIQSKMPSKHMGGGDLTDDLEAYILPGIPWACFFEPKTGVATHGTYWHTNYGVPMSHGCVNMKTEEAKWIFRWTTPVAGVDKIETIGMGTRVIVS